MVTFDDLLEEAGSFGRCQKRIFALLCLLSLLFAGVYAGIVFQGFTPDHWCRDAAAEERRQACGWSPAETAPLLNSSGVLKRSGCEQYELDWNSTEPTCDLQELDLSRRTLTPCKVSSTHLFSEPPAAHTASVLKLVLVKKPKCFYTVLVGCLARQRLVLTVHVGNDSQLLPHHIFEVLLTDSQTDRHMQ